jgi:hypothetical protein
MKQRLTHPETSATSVLLISHDFVSYQTKTYGS